MIRSNVKPPKPTIEIVNDPVEIERFRAQMERHRENSEWLASHWPDVLPAARGKFVAVAGQETFIADTPEQAWAWIDRVHPEDDSGLVHYVPLTTGSRIY
jgi:hypothetical protein